jgi:DNA-binding PadR family transcriptional regulator
MAGLAQLGRFSEPGLLIMVALAGGPKHGYAMQDDIAAMTDERPGPGTLYGAIRRLEEQEYIEALAEDGRRKPYRLTDLGRTVLAAELQRIRAVSRTGLRRLATS